MIDWLKQQRNFYSKKLIKIADTQNADFIYISGRLMMLEEVINKIRIDSLDVEKELYDNYENKSFDRAIVEIVKKSIEMENNIKRGNPIHIYNKETKEFEEIKNGN